MRVKCACGEDAVPGAELCPFHLEEARADDFLSHYPVVQSGTGAGATEVEQGYYGELWDGDSVDDRDWLGDNGEVEPEPHTLIHTIGSEFVILSDGSLIPRSVWDKISFATLTCSGETDQLEKLNLELREQGYEVLYDLGGEIYHIRAL